MDGFCKQHHPDSVKARQEKNEKIYQEKKFARKKQAIQSAIKLLKREGYEIIGVDKVKINKG